MNEKILVVEDCDRLRKYMVSNLEKNGYKTFEADSVRTAFDVLKKNAIELVLLDLRLRDSDGIEVLKTIRRQNESLPVIIVSSVNDLKTKGTSFNDGCDDYITKPFYVDELLMRVERTFKRAEVFQQKFHPIVEYITSGPFFLNIQKFSCTKNGDPITMRKKLFKLMLFFVRNPDVILSNQMLFDRVWDSIDKVNENSIYVHIRALRGLIEDDPSHPVYIRTIRGVGYLYSVSDSKII